jgi:HD-like signal output (HDOD) protein
LEQIAAVVSTDPSTSSRLLKMVNSPLAGLPRQIVAVERAVALLGSKTVMGLALGFSLVSNHRQGKCAAFDYELFWSESVAVAAACRHLAHRVKKFAPDEAFSCGLLNQIGRLALATCFPEEYTVALHTAASDNTTELTEIERAAFETDHNELAAMMMADWHLPAIFCEAVQAQEAPEAGYVKPNSRAHLLARMLSLSGSISGVLTRPTVFQDTLSMLLRDANRLGISPCVFHETFDAISQEWREAGRVFSVRTRSLPPLAEHDHYLHWRRYIPRRSNVENPCKDNRPRWHLIYRRVVTRPEADRLAALNLRLSPAALDICV